MDGHFISALLLVMVVNGCNDTVVGNAVFLIGSQVNVEQTKKTTNDVLQGSQANVPIASS